MDNVLVICHGRAHRNKKFDYIINAFCLRSVMSGSVTHSICDFDGKDTDGHFSLKLFGNIRS